MLHGLFPMAFAFGAVAAPIELGRDDFLDMLGDETDDEVHDALLAPAIPLSPGSRLLVVDEATDLLRNAPHDDVDNSLLRKTIAVAAIVVIAVVIVAAMAAATVTAAIRAMAIALVTIPIVLAAALFFVTWAQRTLQRLQAFKNFMRMVVTHERPPVSNLQYQMRSDIGAAQLLFAACPRLSRSP